jgi:hypothetical protein
MAGNMMKLCGEHCTYSTFSRLVCVAYTRQWTRLEYQVLSTSMACEKQCSFSATLRAVSSSCLRAKIVRNGRRSDVRARALIFEKRGLTARGGIADDVVVGSKLQQQQHPSVKYCVSIQAAITPSSLLLLSSIIYHQSSIPYKYSRLLVPEGYSYIFLLPPWVLKVLPSSSRMKLPT